MTDNNQERYLIVKLSDAKDLANWVNAETEEIRQPDDIKQILKRFELEEGADIKGIVNNLKSMSICHACTVEGQQHTCESLTAQRLGRRLNRLVDRANGIIPPGNQDEIVSYFTPKLPVPSQKVEKAFTPPPKEKQEDYFLQIESVKALDEKIKEFVETCVGEALTLPRREQISDTIKRIVEDWRAEHKGMWANEKLRPVAGLQFDYYVYFDHSKIILEKNPALRSLSEGTYEIFYAPRKRLTNRLDNFKGKGKNQ